MFLRLKNRLFSVYNFGRVLCVSVKLEQKYNFFYKITTPSGDGVVKMCYTSRFMRAQLMRILAARLP